MNIKMEDYEMESMKTPSYPSGHSTQGVLIGLVLSSMYPKGSADFKKAARDISYSRNVAKAHYKSDSDFGKQIGDMLYQHIKENGKED